MCGGVVLLEDLVDDVDVHDESHRSGSELRYILG